MTALTPPSFTTGLWAQQDAAQMVRDLLRKNADDPKMIVAHMPDRWHRGKPAVIVVESDGVSRTSRGFTKEIVRIRVQAKDGPAARKLITLVDAFLTTPSPQRFNIAIRPATGIIAGPDSRIGGWYASATYTVVSNRKVI